ncbi:cysteine desulfurase IscS [Methyloglobulus morosus KoM1]|uniref:Cysteine desulfurase IscS n=1 Tax=Methyloglobulus morosus KoM1 TaxID=1116472 RepID=V5BG47_9GAMM|nr:cysteine desulfurase family protein [Methyloglobulus morosus]ESS72270.1 cysteine desulfurase IscS [Methyloglobulus morosus KoM1]
MIYLDHNATTPIDERVLETMLPFLQVFYGNPSSLYRHGRLVRSAIDSAREQVAALVGVQPTQVIFTSGGTEANNLALTAIKWGSSLAISAVEHPSISEPAENWAKLGCDVKLIGVDHNGLVTQDAITDTIRHGPTLVSIMLANNETGVIQDVASFTQQLRAKGIVVLTDAVQAVGKIPVNYNHLGVNMMTLSSHKIYGPKGCGALIFDKATHIKPLLWGGGQEQGYRAGTENAPAIIGFGKAAELAALELAQRAERLLKLRKFLEDRLMAIPGITIFAKDTERLPNTVQFGIEGMDGEMLLMKLDQKGIAVSSGSACASGGGKPSPVLAAMGVSSGLAKSAIRISLGKGNTETEIIEFTDLLQTLVIPG